MDSRQREKEAERRRDIRVDFSGMLLFQMTVSADQLPPPNEGTIQGKEQSFASIKNVGGKGCCISLDRPLKKFQIIKMDFPLFKVSVSVPTLAEVRWVRPEPGFNRYSVGIRYLL
jgi:hypothetical protein